MKSRADTDSDLEGRFETGCKWSGKDWREQIEATQTMGSVVKTGIRSECSRQYSLKALNLCTSGLAFRGVTAFVASEPENSAGRGRVAPRLRKHHS